MPDVTSVLQAMLTLLAIVLSSLLLHRKITERRAASKPANDGLVAPPSSPRAPRLRAAATAAARAARAAAAAPIARSVAAAAAPIARFSGWERGGRSERRPRSHSTPPERGHLRKRMRALSPNVRVKQRFGQHVAQALGEGHSGRKSDLADYSAADGLRLTREARAQRIQDARPTLPPIKTPSSLTGLPLAVLPSDAAPWDRLHVWLVQGDELPYRSWLWPFEPYVVVTALTSQCEADGPPLSVESFEFETRPEFHSPTNPVWDEQGMVCFRRGGALRFHVVVMSSAKLWSGLYVDRPKDLACISPKISHASPQDLPHAPPQRSRMHLLKISHMHLPKDLACISSRTHTCISSKISNASPQDLPCISPKIFHACTARLV